MAQDIRWKQRFANYETALQRLTEAIDENRHTDNDLIKEGIIQRFEFTHELAWRVMKDFLEYEGIQKMIGSRSAAKEAFNKGIIKDGKVWMDMIESRNRTVHTYQKTILTEEYNNIIERYAGKLVEFGKTMKTYL